MSGVSQTFDSLDKVFLIVAIAGAVLFVARVVLVTLGAGHAHGDFGGMGGDVHSDFGLGGHDAIGHDVAGHGAATHDDSVASFKVLTLQGLTAFLLMFGLLGLALHRGSGANGLVALANAFIGGVAMMVVLGKVTQWMSQLQSSGNLDVRQAIGLRGTVYLTLPAGGMGQVEVCVQRRLKILDALADNGETIKTGAMVEVINVVDGNKLVVRAV